ncbi:MAG: iron ABC transporter permease [Gammaproteobacteria bacterium]|nr:iron ABC transporter permease [Pseudomonadales bacterium]MCP5345595.1 iron ABC transporter permease [Pseudomonadales bacterium]
MPATNGKFLLLICLLTLLCLAAVLLSLTSGSIDLGLGETWEALTSREATLQRQVILDLRLPRTLAALVTGGLLGLSGVIMQVLMRNPLADPYILGVSGGASAAALALLLTGASAIWIPQAAFAGALCSILLVFGLASAGGRWSVTRLLLTGVVVSAGWGAVINLLLASSATNTVQSMLFWLMGDLSQSRIGIWQMLILAAGMLVGLVVARQLNVLVRGELPALSLGVNVSRLRIVLYLTASVLTATAVTIAGAIGFVGLVIPHMLRLLGARDHRLLVPLAALLGGSFLVIADSLARTVIAPQQLPTGVVTALIGVPAFLVILRSTIRYH